MPLASRRGATGRDHSGTGRRQLLTVVQLQATSDRETGSHSVSYLDVCPAPLSLGIDLIKYYKLGNWPQRGYVLKCLARCELRLVVVANQSDDEHKDRPVLPNLAADEHARELVRSFSIVFGFILFPTGMTRILCFK